MPKILIVFFFSCFGCIGASQTEIKYNIVGPIVSMYSEHGLEVEYSQNTLLIPFMRFAYLNRDYNHFESWFGVGETVGKSTEDGFQVWIGNKIKPFTWHFTRNLELLLFYRQSQTDFKHVSFRMGQLATGEGRDKVKTKAIGTGLSFNISLAKWIVVEPF